MFPIGALVWWPCSDLFRESNVCKWICNSRLLGFSPILLINIVASTLWQMKVSSMKLYFGTLVEHYAENSANAECCWRIWKISTSWLAYNSTLRFVKIHRINPGGSGEEAKRAGIHGFWFGGFGLSSSYERRRFALRHCFWSMDIVWLICDGVIRAARRIRASLYMFGGVELLASEECWTWRVRGSWQARLRGLEESGGPERAGSRLKKNGTTEFSDRIKANLSLRQETKIPHGNL